MPDDVTPDETPDEGAAPETAAEDINLDAIAPETPPDPWAVPDLPEDRDTFTKDEVAYLRALAEERTTQARQYVEKLPDIKVEDLDDLVQLHKDLGTEEGAVQTFLDIGTALGLSLDQMKALVAPGTAAPAATAPAEEDDEDLDEVMTRREFQAQIKAERERLEQERASSETRRAQEAAAAATEATLKTLGVDGMDEQLAVLRIADKYLTKVKGVPSPAQVEEAVRKGYDDFEKLTEARALAYIEKKRKAAAGTPKSLGTGAGAGSQQEEREPPKSIAEAIERRKARERAAAGA
jgi:hypothetical protein